MVLDGPKLSQHLNTLPGQTEVQVTQLHLLGEAPLLGPQSLPL